MTALVTALVFTLAVCAPMALLAVFRSQLPKRGALAGSIVAGVLFVFNWLLFYFALPTVGFSGDTFWRSFWIIFIEAVLALGITSWAADDEYDGFTFNYSSGIAGGILTLLLLMYCFAGIWGDDRAHFMSGQLEVTAAPQGPATASVDEKNAKQLTAFAESDPDHIPLMTPDMALAKAKQSMNDLTQIDAGGFHGNAASVYELTDPVFQSISNHAYYVIAPTPSGLRNSDKVDGIVPFYMRVDAENPDAHAVAVTKDNDNNPIQIRYSPGGYFGHDLYRHVWSKYPDKYLDNPTLEIDDHGRAFFTLTKDKLTLNRQPTVPSSLLLVNAQTGVITEHQLDNVPDWVDRVYAQGTVENMLSWWGEWDQSNWQVNESSANRYKVPDDEDPVLIYNKGGHPSYQAILTSYNSDTSAAYLMMVDARTGKATSFQINGLTLASIAKSSVEKATTQQKLTPTHLVLLNIYGQLSWMSPLEVIGDPNHSYQGTAILSATDPNGSSVVWDKTKAGVLDKYRAKVAVGAGNNAGPQSGGNHKVKEGTIQYANSFVEGGNTVIYFGLVEDPNHQFKAIPNDDLAELRSVHVGAKVKVGFLDVGGFRVDVGSYDDLAIPNLN